MRAALTKLLLGAMAIGASFPSAAGDWAGFYFGVVAGRASGKFDSKVYIPYEPGRSYFSRPDNELVNAAGVQPVRDDAPVAALVFGHNWTSGNTVFGVEGDLGTLGLSGSDQKGGTYTCCAPATFVLSSSVSTSWLMTLRGRYGWLVSDWLIFGTAGLALTNPQGHFEFRDHGRFPSGDSVAVGDMSKYAIGWVVGAGIERALLDHWSVRAEYLVADFMKVEQPSSNFVSQPGRGSSGTFFHSIALSAQTVRLGLNYRF